MEAKGIGGWSFGFNHGCCHVSALAHYVTPRCVVPECGDDGFDRVVLPYGHLPVHTFLHYCFRGTTGLVAVPEPL